MSECLAAVQPATPAPPPGVARAARRKRFKREQLIVDCLNRGVSVAEIAGEISVGEKRTRAVIREILARRMPHPPEQFVAIQVSRLNEAMFHAFTAMSPTNLKAVAQVVKIVRELDRYGGAFAAEWARPEGRGSTRLPTRTRRSRARGCRATPSLRRTRAAIPSIGLAHDWGIPTPRSTPARTPAILRPSAVPIPPPSKENVTPRS